MRDPGRYYAVNESCDLLLMHEVIPCQYYLPTHGKPTVMFSCYHESKPFGFPKQNKGGMKLVSKSILLSVHCMLVNPSSCILQPVAVITSIIL